MNVKNLMKQCEMVIKLSNGATNDELDYLYQSAKTMVESDMSKAKHIIFRNASKKIKLVELCNYMRNLNVYKFYVVGDIATQYQWQEFANIRKIVQLGDEYAVEYRL